MPELLPPDDPVTSRPMAGLVLISIFLLMLTVAWSLYDEFYGLRPWRSLPERILQGVFQISGQAVSGSARRPSRNSTRRPQYQKLLADVKAATDAARTQDQQIGQQVDLLDRQRAAMTDAFQTSRGQVGALTYQLEQIDEKDTSAKKSKLDELNEAKAETYDVAWPVEGGKVEPRKFNYQQLNDLFTSIMTSKAKLVAQRGDVDKPAKDAQDKLNEYREGAAPRTGLKRSVHHERDA